MLKYFIGAVLLIGVGYGLVEALPLITGPTLSITSPTNDASYPGGVVTIEGTVLRAAELTLDGATVLHNQNGSFSSTLTFPRGSSILTFVATDRFGRTVDTRRTIFVP
ncbi:MAG: hypothetical protein KGH97_03850 [Patescibacteria group bacterium]|nr:hypothetical protein [Patescibacteria group bacterium]